MTNLISSHQKEQKSITNHQKEQKSMENKVSSGETERWKDKFVIETWGYILMKLFIIIL